jgi:Formyl transferase
MGTPEFAVPVLAAIIAEGHVVAAVYTRAEKPGGRRGLEPTPSPVHMAARRFGIEVVTPRTLRSGGAEATLREFNPDVVVVAAYGLNLPGDILDVHQVSRGGALSGMTLPRAGANQLSRVGSTVNLRGFAESGGVETILTRHGQMDSRLGTP